MRAAKIENGVVVNIAIFDELPDGWVDTGDQRVNIGWSFEPDDVFIAPEASIPDLETLKALKKDQINVLADEALNPILNAYPQSEIESWTIQIEEAEMWSLDNDYNTPFLDTLIVNRGGISKEDLVARILAKADYFRNVSATVIGQRQNKEDLVDAVVSDDPNVYKVELDNISLEYVI